MQKPTEYLKSRNISLACVRWLFRLTAQYKWKILVLVLIRCVLTTIGVGMAVINKYIVDLASASLDMTGSVIAAVLMTACSLAGGILMSVISVRLTEQYAYHIRRHMYAHILESAWSARVKHHSEELLSRITSDVNAITNGVIEVSMAALSTVLQFVLAFGVLMQYDETLAIFAAVTGPIAAIFSFAVGRALRRIQVNLQQSEADYRVFMQEQISNADVVKAFQKEGESLERLDALQKARMRWITKKNRWGVLLRAGINVFFSGTYLFAFISGALKIAAGTITYGTMTAFLSLVHQVQSPVQQMSRILSLSIGVLASAGRVMEIDDIPGEDRSEVALPAGAPESVGLCVRDVSFAYDVDKAVLQSLSFEIKPGELAVVAGPSGIGKTTLIRILLGFLDAECGSVAFVDDRGGTYRCGTQTRRFISYVPQGNTLFSGSIYDNLKTGDANATEAQMKAALEAACALEFVEQLPQGLHTQIGENGLGMSQGQAQRIAIARALIRPAPFLILDEATSALDMDTEKAILEKLLSRRSGQTCLVISHRTAVMEYADCVIALEKPNA